MQELASNVLGWALSLTTTADVKAQADAQAQIKAELEKMTRLWEATTQKHKAAEAALRQMSVTMRRKTKFDADISDAASQFCKAVVTPQRLETMLQAAFTTAYACATEAKAWPPCCERLAAAQAEAAALREQAEAAALREQAQKAAAAASEAELKTRLAEKKRFEAELEAVRRADEERSRKQEALAAQEKALEEEKKRFEAERAQKFAQLQRLAELTSALEKKRAAILQQLEAAKKIAGDAIELSAMAPAAVAAAMEQLEKIARG